MHSVLLFLVDCIPCRFNCIDHQQPLFCGDGFECGHHVGWFRVVRGGAACTLVLVYVSIRLRESVSLGQ